MHQKVCERQSLSSMVRILSCVQHYLSRGSCGLEETELDFKVRVSSVTRFLLKALDSSSAKGASVTRLSHRCDNMGEMAFVNGRTALCQSQQWALGQRRTLCAICVGSCVHSESPHVRINVMVHVFAYHSALQGGRNSKGRWGLQVVSGWLIGFRWV